jgi:putative oxidoreductase
LGLLAMDYGIYYLMSGVASLAHLGHYVVAAHINFGFAFWGFVGTLVYMIGGLFFILGLWFRTVCFLFFLMMTLILLNEPNLWRPETPHALTVAIVMFCFMLIGPGDYKVDV